MLPVDEPSRLYFLNHAGSRGTGGSPPYPCFERFRNEARSFSGMAAFAQSDPKVSINGNLEKPNTLRVSGAYFDVLGVKPQLGRLLTPDDERLDPPVAVISHGFWQRRFGGRPEAIGKTFVLNERTFTIVGVTPRDFLGLAPGWRDDITIPITIVGAERLQDPGSWWFTNVARLRSGIGPEQASAEVDAIFQSFMNSIPGVSTEDRRDHVQHMELTSASQGLDYLRRQFSKPLLVLMGVVGLVLLIACANIANLLLARAAARRREFAVRVAIGAGRQRLLRQLVTETLLLFMSGALLGLVLAWWWASALTTFFAIGIYPIHFDLHWDSRVFGFTAGISVVTALVFGTVPAWRASRTDAQSAMKDGGRGTLSRSRLETGRFLVVLQVALSMVLLVGAGLFVRTLANLRNIDPGFRSDHVIAMSIEPLESAYRQPTARSALWDALLERVQTIPFVRSASLSAITPMSSS